MRIRGQVRTVTYFCTRMVALRQPSIEVSQWILGIYVFCINVFRFLVRVDIGEAKPSRIVRAVIPESSSSESESEGAEEALAAGPGRFVLSLSKYDVVLIRYYSLFDPLDVL